MNQTAVDINGSGLTCDIVGLVARSGALVTVSPQAVERARQAWEVARDVANRQPVYGRTTGVGANRNEDVPTEAAAGHGLRLLRSHAGGGGAPLTVEVVRATMAVRANQIGAGGAGVGEQLLDGLIGMLRTGVTPFVRELGSLGTADLTVLAEIGLVLGGEGECWVGDDVVAAADALAGLLPAARREHDTAVVSAVRSLFA
jgi:histidine ammonia-lyase